MIRPTSFPPSPNLPAAPQLARGEAGPLRQRLELEPHDLGVHLDPAREGAEAAIDSGHHALAPDHGGVAHEALGHELRVLDEVRGGVDDARDDDLVGGEGHVLPDLPLSSGARGTGRLDAGKERRRRCPGGGRRCDGARACPVMCAQAIGGRLEGAPTSAITLRKASRGGGRTRCDGSARGPGSRSASQNWGGVLGLHHVGEREQIRLVVRVELIVRTALARRH